MQPDVIVAHAPGDEPFARLVCDRARAREAAAWKTACIESSSDLESLMGLVLSPAGCVLLLVGRALIQLRLAPSALDRMLSTRRAGHRIVIPLELSNDLPQDDPLVAVTRTYLVSRSGTGPDDLVAVVLRTLAERAEADAPFVTSEDDVVAPLIDEPSNRWTRFATLLLGIAVVIAIVAIKVAARR